MTRADHIAQIIEQPQPINNLLSPRQAIAVNKVFLKVSPHEDRVDPFRVALLELLSQVNPAQSEEFHKNLVIKFFEQTFKKEEDKGTPYFINTKNYEKGEGDLVINMDKTADSSVGVILEFKKPKDHNAEMPKSDQLNFKALQQLLFYFLQERLTHKNLEVKKLVITNIYEWFIFDAQDFEQFFVKSLEKSFNDFIEGRLSGKDTEFFYKNIAKPAITKVENQLKFVYFDLRDYRSNLETIQDQKALVDLFKILSPDYLLKLTSANDSNRLDEGFYNELLHIIGLTVVKSKSKKLIERKNEKDRNKGSLLENVISRLKSLDKLSHLDDPLKYGETEDEQLFSVALALVIVWVNRILFLKLLEAQLLSYHKQDRASFKFLNIDKIKNYADLQQLFFEVLAVPMDQRDRTIREDFSKIPYLNSSLFDQTDLEKETGIVIGLLRDELLPLFPKTILNKTGEMNGLEYLFAFLNSYDFGSEEVGVIKKDRKRLISSSVLGLIFERINGYKDGSYFTPAFITMYMCRETIRRAVVQKFNEVKGWNCQDLIDLYNKIENKKEANEIINSLKICDPAVGSGHFLVSALNEIIAIKYELKILVDGEGKVFKEYVIEIADDELIITDEDAKLFEYNPKSKESQRVQETIFHEKQKIIENCLFGVDINENSVQICRLRLWIELLKNAYYKADNQLETLPNIDINIKSGNSLISRFPIDSDLKSVLFASKNQSDIINYKNAVRQYFEARTKQDKKKAQGEIKAIKDKMNKSLKQTSPKQVNLSRLQSEFSKLEGLQRPFSLGIQLEELDAKAKKLEKEREKKIAKLSNEIDKLKVEIEEVESGRLYENALEWRFEFPEVLNDDGDFIGFDMVIGNPPYAVLEKERNTALEPYQYILQYMQVNNRYDKIKGGKLNLYRLFLSLSSELIDSYAHSSANDQKKNSERHISLIIPLTLVGDNSLYSTRKFILDHFDNLKLICFPQKDNASRRIFEDAKQSTLILLGSVNINGELLSNKISILTYPYNSFNDPYKSIVTNISSIYKFDSKNLPFPLISENEWLLLKKIHCFGSIYDKPQVVVRRGEINQTTLRKYITDNYQNKPLIKGVEIGKYKINTQLSQGKKEYFDENLYLADQKDNLLSSVRRIATQRITGIDEKLRLVATIIEPDSYFADSTNSIHIVGDNDSFYSLEFLLGLLNSSLFQWRFKATSSNNNVSTSEIDSLPLVNLSPVQDSATTTLIKKYLLLDILGVVSDQKILLLCSIASAEITNNLFKHFLSLNISNNVSSVLEMKKSNPNADTTALEKEIDRLVYELYGLTEEEIAIIENNL
jgi:adenine-specific DNA-methyltransferase